MIAGRTSFSYLVSPSSRWPSLCHRCKLKPDAFLYSVNDVKVSNTIDQRGHNVVVGAECFVEYICKCCCSSHRRR
ncbi:hypothetical protein RIF29_05214 [Crotalaria pallida]|uniref:Uncharacterized protein n=1 Tax=Crotalaria pallida TaxID=3830 RepID=A0AAN9J233_CROPI